MFTIFNLLNSEKVPENISNYFFKYLNVYKETKDGNWLKKINLSKIEFYYCFDMTNKNQVFGAYEPLIANNKIFIKPFDTQLLCGKKYQDENTIINYIELLIPTVIHELYHKYQSQKFTKILYILLANPIWRQITLENSADDLTDKAYIWIDRYSLEQTNIKFAELHKKYYQDNFNAEKKEFIKRV